MTRLDALKALKAKVEVGEWTEVDRTVEKAFWGHWNEASAYFSNAYYGSLDAALHLHNAVLPDIGWEVFQTARYPGMIPGSCPSPYKAIVGWGKQVSGHSDTPARAWLIAILEALIEQDTE